MSDITDNMRQYFEPDGAPKEFICGPGTPTPQSDQAATTPGRAEELAAWLDQCAYEEEDSAVKGREIAALLRAQSAELLALRADKMRLAYSAKRSWELYQMGSPNSLVRHLESASNEADAALNSPTQGTK